MAIKNPLFTTQDDTTSDAVIQLHEQLRSTGAYIVRTERGRFSTMTVALSNGVISVYNTKTDEEEEDDNQLTVSDTRELFNYFKFITYVIKFKATAYYHKDRLNNSVSLSPSLYTKWSILFGQGNSTNAV